MGYPRVEVFYPKVVDLRLLRYHPHRHQTDKQNFQPFHQALTQALGVLLMPTFPVVLEKQYVH
jgi:hypothetical protein